jgi:hypothetical protein
MSAEKNTYKIILLPDKATAEMSMLRKVRLVKLDPPELLSKSCGINIFDILQDIDQIKNMYDGIE